MPFDPLLNVVPHLYRTLLLSSGSPISSLDIGRFFAHITYYNDKISFHVNGIMANGRKIANFQSDPKIKFESERNGNARLCENVSISI